jgi:hypothetical protein
MENLPSISTSSSSASCTCLSSKREGVQVCEKSPRLSPGDEELELLSLEHTEEMVKLNVGGTRYYTTKGTLVAGQRNFFAGMFSGKYPIQKDEGGFIFIDRNGCFPQSD